MRTTLPRSPTSVSGPPCSHSTPRSSGARVPSSSRPSRGAHAGARSLAGAPASASEAATSNADVITPVAVRLVRRQPQARRAALSASRNVSSAAQPIDRGRERRRIVHRAGACRRRTGERGRHTRSGEIDRARRRPALGGGPPLGPLVLGGGAPPPNEEGAGRPVAPRAPPRAAPRRDLHL